MHDMTFAHLGRQADTRITFLLSVGRLVSQSSILLVSDCFKKVTQMFRRRTLVIRLLVSRVL